MVMTIINFILAIPKIIDAIMTLFKMVRTIQYDSDVKKNKQIREDVESAKTTEEKQNALNDAGKRFGN